MSRVIATRGLPASGKSTWTNQYLKKNTHLRNVNRDDIRHMVFGVPYKFSKEREKAVTQIQFDLAEAFIRDKKGVIVSDTNLNPKVMKSWKQFAKDHGVPFEIKDFTDVSLKTCLERDLVRANSVGEKVIKRMYDSYFSNSVVKYVGDPTLPSAVIFDIDGTLALMDGRSPFDWSDVGKDNPNIPVVELLKLYRTEGKKIVIMSGRDGVCKPETEVWLADNGIVYDDFFIRDAGNTEKDSIIKERMFREMVAPKYNVTLVVDDRNQVVSMWRSIGLTCFQVADGDF